MGYERYYNKYDSETDPGYFPDRDFDDPWNEDCPLDVELGDKAIKVVKMGISRLDKGITVQEGLGRGLGSLQWAFQCIESNLPEIVVGNPNDPFALRINSPVLDAPKTKKISGRWVKKYLEEYEEVEERLSYVFPCSTNTSAMLFDMEERTGVRSFQLLSTHGAIVYDAISNFLSNGNVVAAINRETRHAQMFPDYLFPSQHNFNKQVEILSGIERVVDMPSLEIFPRK